MYRRTRGRKTVVVASESKVSVASRNGSGCRLWCDYDFDERETLTLGGHCFVLAKRSATGSILAIARPATNVPIWRISLKKSDGASRSAVCQALPETSFRKVPLSEMNLRRVGRCLAIRRKSFRRVRGQVTPDDFFYDIGAKRTFAMVIL